MTVQGRNRWISDLTTLGIYMLISRGRSCGDDESGGALDEDGHY